MRTDSLDIVVRYYNAAGRAFWVRRYLVSLHPPADTIVVERAST